MSEGTTRELSEFDYQLLSTVRDIWTRYPAATDEFSTQQQEGWVTSARIREALSAKSLDTRRGLKHLAVEGLLQTSKANGVEVFRLAGLGARALQIYDEEVSGTSEPGQTVDSSRWTGLVTPVQIHQVLQIVSEIEDAAESITDNAERSQVLGLVGALKILLELPQPPRQGIAELVRDPAFAHIVQIGTFLAAIIAAVKA